MPITDAELINKLVDSTARGQTNWQRTATEDQYAAAFGGKWTVTVDKSMDQHGDATFWVAINNAEGQEILRIRGYDTERLPELFEMARRHALKVNEAIADLLKEIDDADIPF